jgi:hypothetical protein
LCGSGDKKDMEPRMISIWTSWPNTNLYYIKEQINQGSKAFVSFTLYSSPERTYKHDINQGDAIPVRIILLEGVGVQMFLCYLMQLKRHK